MNVGWAVAAAFREFSDAGARGLVNVAIAPAE
jgi:hypothetical protein